MVSVRKKLELVCEMMNEKLERKGMSPLNLKLVAFGMLIHNMSNRNDGSSTQKSSRMVHNTGNTGFSSSQNALHCSSKL